MFRPNGLKKNFLATSLESDEILHYFICFPICVTCTYPIAEGEETLDKLSGFLQNILQFLLSDANIFHVKIFDFCPVFAILSLNKHQVRFNVNPEIRNLKNDAST